MCQEHKIIEPEQFAGIQMKNFSFLYEIYHQFLKTTSKEKATQMTKQYCLTNPPVNMDEELAYLEFMYMNGFFDDLKTFTSSDQFSSETTFLYKILLIRKQRRFTPKELNHLEQLSFSPPSIKCLHLFTLVYLYYDLKTFTGLDKFMDQCLSQISEIKEPLFYYYMKLRFNELAFQHYWKTNNTILAKKYAYKVINCTLSPETQVTMYHNLSLCYLFEGFKLSMINAQIALKKANGYGRLKDAATLRNRTIPFICAFHQQTDNISTPDPIETAHLALASNKRDKAIQILTSLKRMTPFQESYLGLALKDKKMLHQSHQRFIQENGDHFFALLPKYYLKHLI
ncbi:AimR family lysis-lysogeny pheromone receptor [Halobacillus sp. Marseille-Q1614]|uniref:AimR family lysis-lysogeny pheromone receptor n=1 Tax=Halobacillus sp. Marseille-Q1614 TaxID=2709134 RepID=UPI001571531B|nr:AimR family lysis-lysogeny pheromone receptor [Halobacillus sp. Marseille-Q1614]